MAYCANCGNQISDLATSCPQCGTATAPQGAASGGLVLADFGTRFVALLLDSIVLGIASFILGGERGFGGFLVGFLYNWLMIAFNDGRTLGKMVMGIRIAKPDGSAVDLGTAAARAGMALVSGIAIGIGYLWAAWDPENRTWHDMVADTRSFKQPR